VKIRVKFSRVYSGGRIGGQEPSTVRSRAIVAGGAMRNTTSRRTDPAAVGEGHRAGL
jgi:hypothetical protein